ncbi:hypothetical protein Tco_0469195 [Tanacetum coccineum]
MIERAKNSQVTLLSMRWRSWRRDSRGSLSQHYRIGISQLKHVYIDGLKGRVTKRSQAIGDKVSEHSVVYEQENLGDLVCVGIVNSKQDIIDHWQRPQSISVVRGIHMDIRSEGTKRLSNLETLLHSDGDALVRMEKLE